MAKHDENKDVKAFSKIGKVNTVTKTLKAAKTAIIGVHMWGKIDYLTKYCGYVFIWDNTVGIGVSSSDNSSYDYKKSKKEYKIQDKTRRTFKSIN